MNRDFLEQPVATLSVRAIIDQRIDDLSKTWPAADIAALQVTINFRDKELQLRTRTYIAGLNHIAGAKAQREAYFEAVRNGTANPNPKDYRFSATHQESALALLREFAQLRVAELLDPPEDNIPAENIVRVSDFTITQNHRPLAEIAADNDAPIITTERVAPSPKPTMSIAEAYWAQAAVERRNLTQLREGKTLGGEDLWNFAEETLRPELRAAEDEIARRAENDPALTYLHRYARNLKVQLDKAVEVITPFPTLNIYPFDNDDGIPVLTDVVNISLDSLRDIPVLTEVVDLPVRPKATSAKPARIYQHGNVEDTLDPWMKESHSIMANNVNKLHGKDLHAYIFDTLLVEKKAAWKTLQTHPDDEASQYHHKFIDRRIKIALGKLDDEFKARQAAKQMATEQVDLRPDSGPIEDTPKAPSRFGSLVKAFTAAASATVKAAAQSVGNTLNTAANFVADHTKRIAFIAGGAATAAAFAAVLSSSTLPHADNQNVAAPAADKATPTVIAAVAAKAVQPTLVEQEKTKGQAMFDDLNARLEQDAKFVEKAPAVKSTFHTVASPKPHHVKTHFSLAATVGGHVGEIEPLNIATMKTDLATIKRACTYVLGNGLESEFCRSIN